MEKIRALFEESIENDVLDIAARRVGSEIHYGYPVAVLSARKV